MFDPLNRGGIIYVFCDPNRTCLMYTRWHVFDWPLLGEPMCIFAPKPRYFVYHYYEVEWYPPPVVKTDPPHFFMVVSPRDCQVVLLLFFGPRRYKIWDQISTKRGHGVRKYDETKYKSHCPNLFHLRSDHDVMAVARRSSEKKNHQVTTVHYICSG